MDTMLPAPAASPVARVRGESLPQYRPAQVLAIWAAAALPMGALAWVVAPAVAPARNGPAFAQAMVAALTAGLVWQFALVLWLVWREQGSLRWSVLRDALWLCPPRSPRTGRVGGRVWLVVVPVALAVALEDLIPTLPHATWRDLGPFLASDAGREFLHGNWAWFAVLVVMFVCNTVVGEELLFRGVLLPRMHGAFGRFDWVANGLLFAAYHLHVPWRIPRIVVDGLVLAYPSKQYRSALVGIAVHSIQSVIMTVLALGVVLG